MASRDPALTARIVTLRSDGLSWGKIAQRVGISRAAVRDRYLRATSQDTISLLRERVTELEEKLLGAERRYMSAVDGRAKFREAFRKARAKERSARKWVDEFAWPLMDELEAYQNGDPDRAPYVRRIAELEQASLAALERAERAEGALRRIAHNEGCTYSTCAAIAREALGAVSLPDNVAEV